MGPRPLTVGLERTPELERGIAALGEALVTLDYRGALSSDVIDRYQNAVLELDALKHDRKRGARKRRAESELRPWQVEFLKLQRHLKAHRMRMIVLFEGRGAGKGGTIRRVTRYMWRDRAVRPQQVAQDFCR